MSYKTITVHADLSGHAPARIHLAAALARELGAHLVGAAMTGISRFVYRDDSAEPAPSVAAGLDTLHEHARQALEQFESIARAAGVGSFEARLVGDDPEGGLVLLSRYADLLVLSQTDPCHPVAGVLRDLPEYVILNVARPVLIVPYAAQALSLDGKAMVAWDASIEAARALASALPLLRRASEVTVAQFNAADTAGLAAQSADLGAWLARHGIQAQVRQQHSAIDEGDALLSLAADLQVGLVVMGAYGHTRFRELLLGGATKTMLQSMTTPVLMSH